MSHPRQTGAYLHRELPPPLSFTLQDMSHHQGLYGKSTMFLLLPSIRHQDPSCSPQLKHKSMKGEGGNHQQDRMLHWLIGTLRDNNLRQGPFRRINTANDSNRHRDHERWLLIITLIQDALLSRRTTFLSHKVKDSIHPQDQWFSHNQKLPLITILNQDPLFKILILMFRRLIDNSRHLNHWFIHHKYKDIIHRQKQWLITTLNQDRLFTKITTFLSQTYKNSIHRENQSLIVTVKDGILKDLPANTRPLHKPTTQDKIYHQWQQIIIKDKIHKGLSSNIPRKLDITHSYLQLHLMLVTSHKGRNPFLLITLDHQSTIPPAPTRRDMLPL